MKSFIPLESNPQVFNHLIHSLGVSKDLSFYDVYSVDEPELLALIPRPVYALIMVFPVSDTYEKYRHDQDRHLDSGYYNKIAGTKAEDALWFKQTIRNACGTYAALHAVTNGIPSNSIETGSLLDKLITESRSLNVDQRSILLENSQELEHLHESVAVEGATEAPPAEESIENHFVCLTRSRDGHLVELDGRRFGPVDLGSLDEDEDLLCDKSLDIVRGYLKRESENAFFSILALAVAE